ncbi:MAG TPA: NB-ARC domain-containing protein [Candidatus Baltobacteraceae bacterium]|jgi:predicted ATPase
MIAAREALRRFSDEIVGRRREIAEIERLLEDARLVTVAGPGGIGKTRIAAEIASRRRNRRAAATFVELSSINDEALVADAVASAAGLELPPHQERAQALATALGDRSALLVLDNCEQISKGVGALVAHLASACPNLHVLATSRESLGIAHEFVYRLDALDESSAVELFVAHARRANPRFEPNAATGPAVARICARLDRVALAIELAAARTRSMTLEQLLEHLDDRFNLLLSGRNADVLRHQTMQACLDWSYDLLDDRERKVFNRLGVLCGDFTPEAAEAIASDQNIGPRDVLREIGALVDKSLLVPGGDRTHCRMLETIREYAIVRLDENEGQDSARRAHARYFAGRSAAAASSFGFEREETWRERYAFDLENFRAALDWTTQNDLDVATRIVANLAEFWEVNTQVSEGLQRSSTVLAHVEAQRGSVDAGVLLAVARCAFSTRDFRRCLELAERALTLAATPAEVASANHLAGASRCLLGVDAQHSIAQLHRASDFFETQENPFYATRAKQDYAYALAQHDPSEGRRLLLESMSRAGDWPRLAGRIEIRLAELEFRTGNVRLAIEHARSVVDGLRSKHSPLSLGHALVNLGSYLSVAGEYDDAFTAACEATSIARACEIPQWVAIGVQTLALVHAARGNPATASLLLGYVDAFYERYGMKREPTEGAVYDKMLELLPQRLDAAAIAHYVRLGRSQSESKAVALGCSRD